MSDKYRKHGTNICVSNLRDEEYITKFFSKFGEVLESQIIKDSRSGGHKGCAFVKFASMTQADEGINHSFNHISNKIVIKCSFTRIKCSYVNEMGRW